MNGKIIGWELFTFYFYLLRHYDFVWFPDIFEKKYKEKKIKK